MKVLYAIQGTGNGHLSRANDIVPILKKKVDLDVLVSGIQADLKSPFEIDYKMQGLSFIFGKHGGVDIWKTIERSNLRKLWNEIHSLPVENYDLVINDFEMVSSRAAHLKGVPCVSLSHQSAVLHPNAPRPKEIDLMGIFILRHYAPTDKQFGFHFKPYSENIFTPVIRKEIREREPRNDGHYSVYLPAYGDETLIRQLSTFKKVKWQVFSKHSNKKYTEGNVEIFPIENKSFIDSMVNCEGVLCGAGFETPAEALFLKKKVMVIPMKSQYEQHCNAAALKSMGIPVLKNLKDRHLPKIKQWIKFGETVEVDYPDRTEEIVDFVLSQSMVKSLNFREREKSLAV